MNISRRKDSKEIKISESMTAIEYPIMDKTLHGSIIELSGRYPERNRMFNQVCLELCFIIKGSGKLVLEDEEIAFEAGDQLLIQPNQKFYWDAVATIFMPCTPAWYPEQHLETG